MPEARGFKQRYEISARYLTGPSKRRPLQRLSPGVRFIVAHDTGNPGSTAAGNVRYYESSRDKEAASAHIFVDDREIIECIPALTGERQEKAWHVRYQLTEDNRLFGHDANDAALGIEYCYGGRIDADEAYRRYVWTLAWACHRFEVDVARITGHCFLDPGRKTDPVSGLADSRRSFEQLQRDVATEIALCTAPQDADPRPALELAAVAGEARALVRINVRRGYPGRLSPIARTLEPGARARYVAVVENGEPVNGNARWYRDAEGNFFWSGGVEALPGMRRGMGVLAGPYKEESP